MTLLIQYQIFKSWFSLQFCTILGHGDMKKWSLRDPKRVFKGSKRKMPKSGRQEECTKEDTKRIVPRKCYQEEWVPREGYQEKGTKGKVPREGYQEGTKRGYQ